MTNRLCGILPFLLFLAPLVSNIALADAYSSLSDTDKVYVTRVCAPIQYQQDTAAYRNCVEQHSEAIRQSNRTPVALLDFDEQLSIQQVCQKNGAIGSIDYRQCVVVEARSLEGILTADISALSDEDIYAARQSCADAQGGVKAYRQCVNTAVTEQKTPVITNVELPAIALNQLKNEDVAIEDVAIEKIANQDVAKEPATNEPASDAGLTLAVNTNSDELQNNAGETSAISVTPVAFRVDTLPPQLGADESANTDKQNADPDSQEPADAEGLDPATSSKPPLEVAQDFVQKLWAQLLASLEGVTGIDRIILLVALALPFFLIGFWLLMRRGSDESDSYEQPMTLADQVRANTHHSMDGADDRSHDGLSKQQLDFADQIEDLFADDDDPVFADDDTPEFVDENSYIHVDQTAEETLKPTPSSNLGALLENHEKEEQLGLVIEFMIYWMAFTDERYEPELKTNIFAEKEPDDHNLIKRFVLSHNFGAFSEATSWFQKNSVIEEREQVLKLLMALLVYEEGLTPVQNTMLRFLSNAFGFTHNQLNELFQAAFEHALPPMPRPDKPTWWNRQSSDKLKRWDARFVAQQSQSIQARVKLGLSLSGELNPQHIIDRHERAISRCQAENFDLLTSREQQLAESQQTKYNNAAKVLTEISV